LSTGQVPVSNLPSDDACRTFDVDHSEYRDRFEASTSPIKRRAHVQGNCLLPSISS